MRRKGVHLADKWDRDLRKAVYGRALEHISSIIAPSEIPIYDDATLERFARQLGVDVSREDRKVAQELLRGNHCRVEETYPIDALYAFEQFHKYCNWLSPSQIVAHFGSSGLSLFYLIQGEAPPWCVGVSYYVVLLEAFKRVVKSYRKDAINKFLDEHWDEAVDIFENGELENENLPCDKRGLIELRHVYTVYRRRLREGQNG